MKTLWGDAPTEVQIPTFSLRIPLFSVVLLEYKMQTSENITLFPIKNTVLN